MNSMKNKKYLLPVLAVSSILLFTACSAGDDNNNDKTSSPSASSTTAEGNGGPENDNPSDLADGYVAPPESMDPELSLYFQQPRISIPENWEMYASTGAKTYEEDSSIRPLTMTEWNGMRESGDSGAISRIFGEVFYDAEYSASKVSTYLQENPEATLEDIKAQTDLVVNRYPNLGNMEVVQDEESGYFFVILYGADKELMPTISGSLVVQEGITPTF